MTGGYDYGAGRTLATNEIFANGFAPANAAEAAIFTNLLPGSYTAIVAGKNRGTGVGLFELFQIR